jgi:signal transduction histidine kinase/CheY-like chemotaxis protein
VNNIRSIFIYVLIGAAALGTFQIMRALEPDPQAHVTATLGEAQRLEADLALGVLKAEVGLISHYDVLAKSQLRMRDIIASLKHGPKSIYGNGSKDLDEEIDSFETHFKRLEVLLEDFKSDNAIVFNSMRYGPIAFREAQKILVSQAGAQKKLRSINELYQAMIEFRVNRSTATATRLSQAIDAVKPYIDEDANLLFDPPARLLAHATNILIFGKSVNRLAKKVTTLVQVDPAGRVLSAYQAFQNLRHAQGQAWVAALSALSVLFVGLIIVTLFNLNIARSALRRANEGLEDQVANRTRELVAAKTIAENANLAKSKFLSSMSHELRTPMNAILGFGQLLEFDPENPLSADQKKSVAHILSSGNHLLKLISQVLDLATLETGKLEVSIEEVDLNDICQECVQAVEKSAADNGLTIVSEFRSNYTVEGDHARINQVLLSLLSNAIKYNRDGGRIKSVVEDLPTGMVRVSISDTGPGISENDHQKIFEAFNRLGKESSNIEGSGVGLTVSKQLVEAMDGKIGLNSSLGEGSTFWIEFSAKRKKVAKKVVSETKEDSPKKAITGKILYIEDNLANQQLMDLMLAKVGGLELMMAHNAELGIKMAVEHRPDLILMDLNLPGADGFSAMKQLQEIDLTKDIPIIAVTASAMKEDVEKGLAGGFRAYVTKPFDVPELIKVIQTEINR